jgi:hypothetical protein
MGWVMMSERELNRVEVLAQVDDGRLSVDNAANMLDLTRRQIFRLLKRYRQAGAAAIRHRSRGRTPNNQIHRAKRDYALSLVNHALLTDFKGCFGNKISLSNVRAAATANKCCISNSCARKRPVCPHCVSSGRAQRTAAL